MKTAYFVKIDAENNNNRYYKMYQNSPKSFLVEIGRVGIQPITRPYPLSSGILCIRKNWQKAMWTVVHW